LPRPKVREIPEKSGIFAGMAAALIFASVQKGSGGIMDNSLLVGLSQQLASYRSMDVIANNLANLSTPGFKRESAKFEEYVTSVRAAEDQKGPQQISFVKDAGTMRDISQGNIQSTGAPLDLAIDGKGFFVVATAQGNRYTRDGHFTLDADGHIVTSDGYALQGEGGAITVSPTDGDIRIAKDGTVSSVLNGAVNQLGKLQLADFANESSLNKEGDNLYSTSQAIIPATGTLQEGMLESSNVQPVVEISKMIEVMRAYEATATLTKSQEDLSREAITKLGAMPN
jgi:flagellar basal-body rod protein FlgF